LLAPSDIRAGKCYSEQSRDVRPFGIPHQRILLNFIDSIGENFRAPYIPGV